MSAPFDFSLFDARKKVVKGIGRDFRGATDSWTCDFKTLPAIMNDESYGLNRCIEVKIEAEAKTEVEGNSVC
jgi:hypothetical protein